MKKFFIEQPISNIYNRTFIHWDFLCEWEFFTFLCVEYEKSYTIEANKLLITLNEAIIYTDPVTGETSLPAVMDFHNKRFTFAIG